MRHQAHGLAQRRPAPPLQPLRQALALQPLHDDERLAVVVTVIHHRHDVSALDARGDLGLALEARQGVGVACRLGMDELHGHRDAESDVLGAPDLAHGSLADELLQPVPAGHNPPTHLH